MSPASMWYMRLMLISQLSTFIRFWGVHGTKECPNAGLYLGGTRGWNKPRSW